MRKRINHYSFGLFRMIYSCWPGNLSFGPHSSGLFWMPSPGEVPKNTKCIKPLFSMCFVPKRINQTAATHPDSSGIKITNNQINHHSSGFFRIIYSFIRLIYSFIRLNYSFFRLVFSRSCQKVVRGGRSIYSQSYKLSTPRFGCAREWFWWAVAGLSQSRSWLRLQRQWMQVS